jgi:uncharacterized protein YbjT (DUF2867 family)
MNTTSVLTLVTGATGAQGGATARELLTACCAVRVLTRNPESRAARDLASRGAEIQRGDLDDSASLQRALSGAHAVFSVQLPDSAGADAERRVCESGRHTSFPRWESGYWWQKYWTDKWDVEEAVRHAGFERWTVLKPAFLMDNFAQPKAKFMFPHLQQGRIVTALRPDTRMQLISADDVGAFARAAILEPQRFDHRDIELAVEALTMTDVAATLSRVLGKRVEARSVSPDEAIAAGLFAGWVRSQEWTNEVGYRADIGALAQYGVRLTPFEEWIRRHAGEIVIDA